MKYLKYIFIFIIMLFPILVFADTCNTSGMSITDLGFSDKSGSTREINVVELENNKISADVKMYEVGDSISYQFSVRNDTGDDLAIDANSLVNSNRYIQYKIDSEDHSNTIKKSSAKDFILTASYQNEVPNESFKGGKYDASIDTFLMVTDPSLINPYTGNFFFYLILAIIAIVIAFAIKIGNKKLVLIAVSSLVILPFTTHAFCTYTIDIDFDLDIGYVKPNPCTYDGELVQGAEYVNGQYTYRYKQQKHSSSNWNNIDADGWGVVLSDKDSTSPVTTTLCTTINDKPIVSMIYMFVQSKTTSIDTSSFDTSSVENMSAMFSSCGSLTNIDVSNFDTSSVEDMSAMFYDCGSLTSIDVSNFDTSNVKSMTAMFYGTNISGELDLSHFNTSNVTSLSAMFSNSSFSNVNLSNFDLRNVQGCGQMFSNSSIESIVLDNWIVKSNLVGLLYLAPNIKSISMKNWKLVGTSTNAICRSMGSDSLVETIDVTGWDLSNATDIAGLFASCSKLVEINGLDTWDTSNITYMPQLFSYLPSIETLDLSSFDMTNVTNTTGMFENSNSLTTVYARTQTDIDKFSASGNLPTGVQFILKNV